MCHQYININPNIITWAQLWFRRGSCKNLLCHCHSSLHLKKNPIKKDHQRKSIKQSIKMRSMRIKKELTEPVVAGLRSDCWGAMTETIFLETCFLHLWMAICDVEGKTEKPKSFWPNQQQKNGFFLLLVKIINNNQNLEHG